MDRELASNINMLFLLNSKKSDNRACKKTCPLQKGLGTTTKQTTCYRLNHNIVELHLPPALFKVSNQPRMEHEYVVMSFRKQHLKS